MRLNICADEFSSARLLAILSLFIRLIAKFTSLWGASVGWQVLTNGIYQALLFQVKFCEHCCDTV